MTGTVELQSVAGQGTEVRFTLPVSGTSGSNRPAGRSLMASVLIVDDEPNIRRMLAALLAGEGYEVRDAPDGESAIAAAAEVPPDAVLLDLMMPGPPRRSRHAGPPP